MKFYNTKRCVEEYNNFEIKIANMLSDLDNILNIAENISEERKEECHPSYSGREAMEKLGLTLAHIVSYKHEYEEELKKGENKNEN